MGKIADKGNPYPGSRAFQQADYARFYGRDADTASVVDLWMTNRLTMITGPVASGKTSLLLAGVYPLMPAKRPSILPAGNLFHGMTFPFAALPEHNPLTFALLRSWSPDDIPTRLAGLSISEFIRRFMQVSDGPTYAAIDQLDDVILDPQLGAHARWRQEFLAELTQALDDHPRLHLLLVARSETIGLLTETVGGGARHATAGLTVENAVEALTKPALAAGRSFADDAISSLIDDLRNTNTARTAGVRDEYSSVASPIEPSLLQVVCRQLWDQLPTSISEISEWALGEFGDADTALASHCALVIGQVAVEYAEAIDETAPQCKPPSKLLRARLIDSFVTDNGTRGGAYEGMPTATGLPDAVLRSLVHRHLLTRKADKSTRRYRLLTDRLIEPLRIANVDHAAAATTAEYLAVAERELALGELGFAWQNGQRALGIASGPRDKAYARSLLGNVAYERGPIAEALPHYREAADLLQAVGDNSTAASELAAVGRVLLADGRVTAALPELRAAVERTPYDLVFQTQLALALWQLGEGRTAVAILNWVLSIEGGYVEARGLRGEILADLGEGKNAIADLDRAIRDRPSTRAARGLALAELGDHAAATEEIKHAVTGAERNGSVLFYAARVLDLGGDKISAREWAREAMEATDPPLTPQHRQLAQELAGH